MQAPGILVTDGHLRPSLAVVRSVGRAGFRVHVCSPRRHSLSGASRYAADDVQVPPSLSDPDGFSEAVLKLARRHDVALIFPMSEESMLAILPAMHHAPGISVPFAPLDTFQRASDKRFVMELAQRQGIAVPDQTVLEHPSGLTAPTASAIRFPVVIKPSRSVAGEGANRDKLGVSYAKDPAELRSRIAEYPLAAYPLLLQQKIEGPGTGIFLLMWESQVVAQFAHRRIREKPPTGGVSVCSESIQADPATASQARALLTALNWQGPAMVEFKEDRFTGTRYLMEINGRFWGSLQLAIDAGVDFPALLAAAALGKKPTPVLDYRVGVRTHWWWGEVDHLIARVKSDRRVGNVAGALATLLLSGRGTHNEVLRMSDPRPAARETVDWFQGR